jgi:hypothetical protein
VTESGIETADQAKLRENLWEDGNASRAASGRYVTWFLHKIVARTASELFGRCRPEDKPRSQDKNAACTTSVSSADKARYRHSIQDKTGRDSEFLIALHCTLELCFSIPSLSSLTAMNSNTDNVAPVSRRIDASQQCPNPSSFSSKASKANNDNLVVIVVIRSQKQRTRREGPGILCPSLLQGPRRRPD